MVRASRIPAEHSLVFDTCRAFIGLCRQMNMFTDVMVAIDGSKFKAVNSKENNYTPKKLQFHIARVEKHIDKYLKQLDDSDKADEKHIDGTPIKDKLAWLEKRLSELKALEVQVNDHPDKQLSTTDPDSRLMKTQGMTRSVCYNVQTPINPIEDSYAKRGNKPRPHSAKRQSQ